MASIYKFAMHTFELGTLTSGKFLSNIKRNTAHWKEFLYDVLAMVKELGLSTYFWKFSFAYLRWKKFPYIINKLSNLGLRDEEQKRLISVIC